ncbi:hypothetical protein [Draconibacterium halophilum]|uniref:GLPGLI family protein n=1 Tax=Draconibacterium halophilum TaxID=2706887 RepID=A0A6C0R947_9BACT|nr:hypothetical protein [Draconibacterium halophilum]QIA06462.1 hypothetical protein G0Q07_01375 [Draconibacterium halophilum]
MKNTVKRIATGTFIALLLMVGNVKATELKVANSFNIETETTLQMENWMTNQNIWNTNATNMVELIVETESSMAIENWMTNPEVWNSTNSVVEEVETGMEIENWMINDKIWNTVSNENE